MSIQEDKFTVQTGNTYPGGANILGLLVFYRLV